jgi:hypothetical protein
MNHKNLLCLIALFAGLQSVTSFAMNRSPRKKVTRTTARQTGTPVIAKNETDINNEINNEVQKILEWAATEKEIDEDAFNNKKNTSPILNPTEKDTPITLEAKKRAKDILFPESSTEVIIEPEEPTKSYWQSYAPQFMQDATTATSNYVASWIPQSIKDRINSWSTRKKVAVASAIIVSLAAIYNRDTIISMINTALDPEKKVFHNRWLTDNDIYKLHTLKPKLAPWLKPLSHPIEENWAQEYAEYLAKEEFPADKIVSDLDIMITDWANFKGSYEDVRNRLNKDPNIRLPYLRAIAHRIGRGESDSIIRSFVILLQKLAPKDL